MSATPAPPHQNYLPPLATAVCQSDDQFFVWDYAIRHGWDVKLHSGLTVKMGITLPFEFEGEKSMSLGPFDDRLHRLAQHLKENHGRK